MKYIPFSTVQDLRNKLGLLETIVEENREIIENYLLLKGIDYEILPDGSYAVDLANLNSEELAAYNTEFSALNRETIFKYKKMGIFYFDPQSIVPECLNLTDN